VSSELRRLLTEVIDRSIRFCSPEKPESYAEFDAELGRLETMALALNDTPEKLDLLAQLQSHRIHLASEAGQHSRVVEVSEAFIQEHSPALLDFFNVAAARSRALHALGRHGDEIRETVKIAQGSELRGSEFVLLLENLIKRHPGSIGNDASLLRKMEDAITHLHASGYTNLPEPPLGDASVEQLALNVAAELRRVNRTRGEALLAGDLP
jgi:hypothetical protein